MKIRQHIDIPDNIAEYVGSHNGCNLSININSTDGLNGYGMIEHFTVELSILTKTCYRCGYDPLWNPEVDDDLACSRHSYSDQRYDEVFVWRGTEGIQDRIGLEDAFNLWLQAQPKRPFNPVKRMFFGWLSDRRELQYNFQDSINRKEHTRDLHRNHQHFIPKD